MIKKKVLIIVAHPDDETLWMGGTIIKNSVEKKNWDTTILTLCRKDDIDRNPKFKKMCEFYDAKCFMSDLDDEFLEPIDLQEIIKRILDIAEKDYDEVYTHGENGEYGHLRHMEVHLAVKKIIEDRSINSKEVFFFSYKKVEARGTDTGFDSYAYKTADKFIKLNEIEFLLKKSLMTNYYGFSVNSFEERNCREFEAFDKMKK